MQRTLTFFLALMAFAGCGPREADMPQRRPITLDEFAVTIRDGSRRFLLSDKRGGFLTGTLAPGAGDASMSWAVNGRELVGGIDLMLSGNDRLRLDSALVRADRITLFYAGGATGEIATLESGENSLHAFSLSVHSARTSAMTVRLRDARQEVSLFAAPAGAPARESLTLPAATEGTVLVTDVPAPEALSRCRALYAEIDTLSRARAARMVRLLNTTFVRTSDDQLNHALYWMKLAVDALVVEGRDTVAVAGLPWDGSLQAREIAESAAEIGRTTGDVAEASALFRNLARWQDRDSSHSSFGRLARTVSARGPVFDAADIGLEYTREMYDHIVSSGDTSLIAPLASFVRAGIAGARRYHTDTDNLLTHGETETWMEGVKRGNRAAEVQQLWYFQQTIGSYLASHAGEKMAARDLGNLATRTAEGFQQMFIDTSRNIVYDHLRADGSGVAEARPNAILCLEILGSELVQQEMLKETIRKLVYPYGVGTLASDDKRFVPFVQGGAATGWKYSGPVWNWLGGPCTYALTRYDLQDFGFAMTSTLAQRALSDGMIGTLPEMYEAETRHGEGEPHGAGLEASLTAMTQFLGSWEQNYLGARVDVPGNQLFLEPKLPKQITSVDFTVLLGHRSIHGTLTREEQLARITLFAPDLERDLDCSILWVLDNGDAWRAAVALPPGKVLRVAFGPDDVSASLGDRKIELAAVRKLVKFSLRDVFSGITFANAPR